MMNSAKLLDFYTFWFLGFQSKQSSFSMIFKKFLIFWNILMKKIPTKRCVDANLSLIFGAVMH